MREYMHIQWTYLCTHTHSHTIAPGDFEEVLEVIPISNATIPITINDDLLPESTEYFAVNISATDEAVTVLQAGTQVIILDNGEVLKQ